MSLTQVPQRTARANLYMYRDVPTAWTSAAVPTLGIKIRSSLSPAVIATDRYMSH